MKVRKLENTTEFVLQNEAITLTLLSYGARITSLVYDGKDVVLGYDTIEDLRRGPFYTGATVGRYANRIEGGRFELNGVAYQLEKNEGNLTHIHGGTEGFDQKEWDHEILSDVAVRFSRVSPDGEMGYPGTLTVSVTYTLEKDGVLIAYRASSDRDTILNLTNHAYFNLDGYDGEDCRKMELRLDAPRYLPVDERLIPIGAPASVDGNEFDFRIRRPIRGEYDHCFVLTPSEGFRTIGELYSPKSGIGMTIGTDLPAIQVYTCGWFVDAAGKGGIPLHEHQGVALETQFYPNSPNRPDFPSTVLKGGTTFESKTAYRFYRGKE